SDGAGSATTRKTRGLTRSVIALMVPPLPAASRPSKTTTTLKPFSLTQSWSLHNSTCRARSDFSYSLRRIGLSAVRIGSPLLSCQSVCRSGHGRGGSRGTNQAKDQFFRLHQEEEHQAPEDQPGPDPKRHRFGAEQSLERRGVGEQELQDHDRGDSQTQVLVAKMRLERQ